MRRTALAMLGPATLAIGAAAEPPERIVQHGETVAVSVNGVPGRLRIEPGAPGLMILTDRYAASAGLKGGGMLGFGIIYHVGDQTVKTATGVARVSVNGARPGKRRVGWAARPYRAGAEAVVGPGGLDAPVVRFVLHAPAAGERTVALPMADGGLFGGWGGTRATLTIGGEPVLVRFDPDHRRTVANAVAGQRIAEVLGGRLQGTASSEEIAFGIARPVRTLVLARPLTIGPLSLDRMGVRTVPDRPGDAGPAIADATDPAAAAAAAAADSDEVVVVGRKGKRRAATLTLGADQLARCSSILFDKRARQIRLSCI